MRRQRVSLLMSTWWRAAQWLLGRAVTDEERAEALRPSKFGFGGGFATMLTYVAVRLATHARGAGVTTFAPLRDSMLLVTLIYSPMVPIILPCGLAYFLLRHWLDKRSLLCFAPRAVPSRGRVTQFAVRIVPACLLIYQVLGSCRGALHDL